MAFEIITLNLIPDGEMPVFHASQFDTARPVIIDLVMGEDAYVVPEGITLELHCRKVDDTIVTMEPDEVSENRVTFVTTEQLTACIGDNLCEVAVLNGDDHIGTLNFILHVEPDPLAGGLTSESDIYNLTQQIEDIATEVIGEDYYDKTEVDALLADKADVSDLPDMSNYYTKSQVYNKTETDSLLADKADVSDLPDMSNYYTKSQIDNTLINNYATYGYLGSHYYNKASTENLIDDAVTLRGEAEGAIASFNTALSELPDTLNCYFNVPGGITELNVTRTGVNLWDEEWENGQYDSAGAPSPNAGVIRTKNYIPVVGGQAYNFVSGGNWIYVCQYDRNKSFIGTREGFGGGSKTLLPDCCFVRFNLSGSYGATYNNDISVNYPATDSTYHAFAGSDTITLDLNGTYTEGYVDPLNGKLYDTSVTPAVEHDITRKWIYQAEGVNNFFSDGNDKTYVKYKDTIQHYIDTRL